MRRLLAVLVVLTLVLSATPLFAAPRATNFAHLAPGERADLSEQVPVNFVFVGYEPEEIDVSAFLGALPSAYKPVIRSRLWYGITEYLGIHYTFDYNTYFTDAAYESQFFNMLSANAVSANLTLFQQQYNAQNNNVLDITQNHFIDAPTVEKWLSMNPPAGVDTTRNTVFFINWWGSGEEPRPGFKHHVYTKFGEPDPDTGYDFGLHRETRKIIAWGGTTPDDEETGLGSLHRIWFHDLSAGPEGNTDNWNVDTADLDGDGVADYRMPPVWEYFKNGGYRAADELTADLARIARYGAINLLFTPSPLYPPAITPSRLPSNINLDFNTFNAMRGVADASAFIKGDLAALEIGEVHQVPYTYDHQTLPFTGDVRDCYNKQLHDVPCS